MPPLPPACAAETARIDKDDGERRHRWDFHWDISIISGFNFKGVRGPAGAGLSRLPAGLEPAPTKPKFRRYSVTSQRAAALTIWRTDDMDRRRGFVSAAFMTAAVLSSRLVMAALLAL